MYWDFTVLPRTVEFDDRSLEDSSLERTGERPGRSCLKRGLVPIRPRKGTFMRRSLIAAVALFGAFPAAKAQVELKNYADPNGYIDVQQLTCAQLAGTYQEDADFLGVWYSGWYNGLAKKHAINVPRTKAGIHNVIVYCKANPGKKVIQAIDVILKEEKN